MTEYRDIGAVAPDTIEEFFSAVERSRTVLAGGGLWMDICKRIVALEQPDPERHQINALADAIEKIERHILEAKS